MIAFRNNVKGLARMTRSAVVIAGLAALAGCASPTPPLAKCDGYARRPLNRAMWDWEGDRKVRREPPGERFTLEATPYVEETETPPALAHLDIDGSRRRCMV
jgi:type IV secretion system protein VirB7